MKIWSWAGGLALVIVGGTVRAQSVPLGELPPLPGEVSPVASAPLGVRRSSYQPPGEGVVGETPSLPSATLPGTPPPTAGADAPPPPAFEASPGGAEPLSSNTDLRLPASEREGLGGEPTEAVAEAEAASEQAEEKDPTQLLMNALGLEESPIKFYGWIQNSFTGNANGNGTTRTNFGVNPNFMANKWMGNQYYFVVEKPVEQNDTLNFGFRVDNLFGHDWAFNHMYGLFDGAWPSGWFPGYDPAQFYAEMHIPPILSKGGTDVKGGRFYTILGYEVVPATGRPLLSVPYMFNYGQPFTHFGMLATTHVTDRLNWLNGTINGWDRFINENY
ncbi:MAG: outer membrane beta-barrel protein, partial [Isosphaeraceae bacterium]